MQVMEFIISILPLILFMVLIYFLTIRPQKKRQEEHKAMIDRMQKGDTVVTIGGLHGVVDEQNDSERTVVLDCEGIYLTFEKRAIAQVLSKADSPRSGTQAEDLGTNQPSQTEESEEATE